MRDDVGRFGIVSQGHQSWNPRLPRLTSGNIKKAHAIRPKPFDRRLPDFKVEVPAARSPGIKVGPLLRHYQNMYIAIPTFLFRGSLDRQWEFLVPFAIPDAFIQPRVNASGQRSDKRAQTHCGWASNRGCP